MKITDEMMEAGIKAAIRGGRNVHERTEQIIAAVAPLILEVAAKVAEADQYDGREIAVAIRAALKQD